MNEQNQAPFNGGLNLYALKNIPLIHPGDDLAQIILDALQQDNVQLQVGDVLVIASKVISKAEGRYVDLNTITPTKQALELALMTRKDPRIVQLTLDESVEVSRSAPHVLVTRHRLGFVSANAGIDQSNVEAEGECVLLLPLDPDASAAALRQKIQETTGLQVGIVVSDTHGRPFRMGNVGVAIGCAGLPALVDLRGTVDLFGRVMQVSTLGYADLVASAAHLIGGEGAEGTPVVCVRGLNPPPSNSTRAGDLYRPAEQDLYR